MESEEIWIPPIIPTFCRICVTVDGVDFDIYDSGNDRDGTNSLHMMMKDLFPAVFNDEQAKSEQNMNWPSNVCQDCMHLVSVAYGLYELCITSTDRLSKLLTGERYAIPTDEDGIKEENYLPEFVQTELTESDSAAEHRSDAQECLGEALKKRKSPLPKKNQKKQLNILSVEESLYGTENTAAQHISTPGNNSTSDANDAEKKNGVSPASKKNYTDKESNHTKCATKKSSKKKLQHTRRQKETIADVSDEAQQGTVKEPQSKIDLYRCQLCDAPTYTSPTELNDHLKAEHSDQIRCCEQCPKLFMNEQSFQHHQYCHATGRSHFCTFCDKGFQTLDLLKSHIRTHTHRADYLCSLCGKEFNNKSNLRQHVKRHTGDKPWACSQCPGRFTTKGGLTSHQHTHTKVKAFSCDTCGSQFNKHYSLIKHQLIHSGTRPYSCEVCGMRFTSSYHVKRHMRTHTGEKPFKCTYCVRCFAQSNDMVKHMRTHVGDNPYQCDRCDASYRLLTDLRNHYKDHYQSGEKAAGCSNAEDEIGIRFTSTDILKLRYRKEMAQCHLDGYADNAESRKVKAEATEFPAIP